MQAYAKAELAPAEPEFSLQPAHGDGKFATRLAVDTRIGSRQSASAALATLLLDGLDEHDLELLAKRLAPHLVRLYERNPVAPHIAYTVQSLAAELGVSQKAIRCAIARGELHGVKRGSRWIIPAEAVNEWATTPKHRRTKAQRCSPRAPKAAGPSLRSVLCASRRGGSR